MKKKLIVIFILVTFFLCAVYLFIPGKINISVASVSSCIPKNIAAALHNENTWGKWWPSGDIRTGYFTYKNRKYKLINPYTDGAEIELSAEKGKTISKIMAIPLGKDSAGVEWKISLDGGMNPFKRIAQYFEAREIKNNMQNVLNSLVNFAARTENIYGFHIERTTFTDTVLAMTKFSTNTYPSIEIIYKAIDELKQKVKKDGATERDFPMLNILQTESNHFETMIAICIDKIITSEGNIFISRMVPMKDRFLKTEVTGGSVTIKNAHNAIESYMDDRFLSAPAIPFEILVTDRRNETDTTKWKTTIFHPSM
jgi:hypothetical protein